MIEFFIVAIFFELAVGIVGVFYLLRHVVEYVEEILLMIPFPRELPHADGDDQSTNRGCRCDRRP